MSLDKMKPPVPPKIIKKRISFLIFLINVLCFWGITYWIQQSNSPKTQANKISENYWPMAYFQGWHPLPDKESVIDHTDELNYFKEWINLIEEGISNRYNINKVLESKRSKDDYLDILQLFKNKQNSVISRLRTLPAPDRLQSFHNDVIEAASDQIHFYEEWAGQKQENQEIKLNDLTENGDLKRCNELLWKAYHSFQALYPNLDKATNDAIEMRLCQFDMI